MTETPSQYPVADSTRLIVWENDGFWARQLRRALGPDGPRVYEARTGEGCYEMVAESPASIVVAWWAPAISAEFVQWISRIRRRFPDARAIAVSDRRAEAFRWKVFQTGVAWLCTSPRELVPVVDIIRRHIDIAPRPTRTAEQRIWDGLPWPRPAAFSRQS